MPARRIEVLFLPEDEDALVVAVRQLYPDMLLVDQRRWTDPLIPPARASLGECGDVIAIWVPSLAPGLRGTARDNGRVDGPQVGPVIQWLRTSPAALDPDLYVGSTPVMLQAGSLAASTTPETPPGLGGLQRAVWKAVKQLSSNRLRTAGSLSRHAREGAPIRSVHAGHHALAAANAGRITLAHNQLRLIPDTAAASQEV